VPGSGCRPCSSRYGRATFVRNRARIPC
jgi:hypothetical protein